MNNPRKSRIYTEFAPFLKKKIKVTLEENVKKGKNLFVKGVKKNLIKK
jgi:hypothetical protein